MKDNRLPAFKNSITTQEINLKIKVREWLDACYVNLAFAAFYGHTKAAEKVVELLPRESELKILKKIGIEPQAATWGEWLTSAQNYLPGMTK